MAVRKTFRVQKAADFTILQGNAVFGHIRVKPSNLLWKGKGDRKWFNVKIEKFQKWVTATKAGRKTKK
jgi:hypothetical protein